MLLTILGYIFGIGFIVFGISALALIEYEIYKYITKRTEKINFKSSIYLASVSAFCVAFLIVAANVT
ncbi:hypothetical protein [Salinicoccus albus]|uniref:hypothetical protein n=1 Tax=Salinicoccus albus TaxID=418756 RepID=UPI000364AEC0|nr:hypothetical protein [Salinicoccus albus]